MTGPLLEGLTAVLLLLGLLSAAISAAVLGLDRLFALRARVLRGGLGALLREIRRDEGHCFAPHESWRDAGRILAAARSGSLTPPRIGDREPSSWQWAPAADATQIGAIAQRVLPDFRDLGEILAARFAELEPALRKRFRRWIRLGTVVIATGVAVGLQLDALSLLASLGEGLGVVPVLPPPHPFWIGGPAPNLDSLAGIAITVVVLSFGAPLVFEGGRLARRATTGSPPRREPSARLMPKRKAPELIGEAGRAVRAINFAGGGFETLMQLGVTHALLVIKGRAPDAVVGVSAGAIQAAALAETLQAGGRHGPTAFAEDAEYGQILRRRVQRYREFLFAARRAPEHLIDALLPDAYQIDSNDPLRPLETPAYAREEREGRLRGLQTRSGLVRLYNRLLSVHLSIGTIARIIRRFLGFRASAEVRTFRDERGQRSALRDLIGRTIAQTIELFRIWLLVGDNLLRMVPLVDLLLRPFFQRPLTPSTAGRLIFRFGLWDRIQSMSIAIALFLPIVLMWVAVSWAIASAPFVLAELLVGSWLWGFLSLALVLFLLLPLFENLRQYHNTERAGELLREVRTGVLVFGWTLLRWSPIYVLIVFGVIQLLPIEPDSGRRFRWLLWWSNVGAYGLFGLTMLVAAAVRLRSTVRGRRGRASSGEVRKWYVRKLLTSYGIHESLADNHPLEYFLANLFDQKFYGDPDFDEVVDRSLADRVQRPWQPEDPERKRIGSYAENSGCRKIHLGLAAADVGSGKLEVIDPDRSIVEGLVAATAAVPVFAPKRIGRRLYIDGTSIRSLPMRGLIKLLRERVNEKSVEALVYSVSPFPMSRPFQAPPSEETGRPTRYLDLIDIALRARELQRYQDASMETQLTRIYTRVLAPDELVNEVDGKRFFRASVTPIELDEPAHLWRRLVRGGEQERHRAIEQVIADGCRASLEVMIRGSLGYPGAVMPCSRAVEVHLNARVASGNRGVLAPLPGKGPGGPGLREICNSCALRRGAGYKGGDLSPQTLRMRSLSDAGPAWPHEGEDKPEQPAGSTPDPWSKLPEKKSAYPENWPRPRPRDGRDGVDPTRPVTSLLLSGGVFRGVFQMGVLNALVELNLEPDLIGGASIGSITAAMAARTFHHTKIAQTEAAPTFEQIEAARRRHIARLASAYLAVDRLILTDRFADFVRNFTIRAAATDFSLRDADKLFRRYDHSRPLEFSRSARRVIAGLERLLYVNPYQLNELTQTIRERQGGAAEIAQRLVQQWLRRMDVGEEVLGAEPLEDLIRYDVIAKKHRHEAQYQPFDSFALAGTVLLATTTNLTAGTLDILGEPITDDDPLRPRLVEALLASSAFPGVFRPRWSWDLFPAATEPHQYVDGGVMDNLPFEPVARYLVGASRVGLIPARPKAAPHLVLAASLEPDVSDVRFEGGTWLDVRQRAKQLSYNGKIDMFAAAEEDVRNIWSKEGVRDSSLEFAPVDLEVMAVKPLWLPGTFGFHPMLGFRRRRQAASIAHGCASTLLEFGRAKEENRKGWGIKDGTVPRACDFETAWERWDEFKGQQGLLWSETRSSVCWLRPERPCPFSRGELLQIEQPSLQHNTVQELSEIHRLCRLKLTHAPPAR